MRTLTFFLLLACSVLAPDALKAISWTGMGQTGNWNDAGNWSPNQVPGPGDAAFIGSGFSPYISTPVTVYGHSR